MFFSKLSWSGWRLEATGAIGHQPAWISDAREDVPTVDFLADDDLSAVAADLAGTVAEYGQPFIDRWSNWVTYSTEIEDSGLLLDNDRFLLLRSSRQSTEISRGPMI